MNSELNQEREEIDKLDAQLVELLQQRLHHVERIFKLKSGLEIQIQDPQRELDIYNKFSEKLSSQQVQQKNVRDFVEALFRLHSSYKKNDS